MMNGRLPCTKIIFATESYVNTVTVMDDGYTALIEERPRSRSPHRCTDKNPIGAICAL